MDWPAGWDPTWNEIGSSTNCRFYLDHAQIVITLPYPKALDTADTARENVEFLHGWFAAHEEPPLLMIFFDRFAAQDRAARKTYLANPWVLGCALIGGTMLTRALASFLIGVAQRNVRVKLFPAHEEARAWLLGLPRRTAS